MKKLGNYLQATKGKTIAFLVFLAVMILIPLLPRDIVSNYAIHILVIVLLYSYWSCAWNLLSGFCGQLSQGHAAYVGLGAYTAVILYTYHDLTPWVGMLAAGLVAGLFSLIIGLPCFRLKGSYFTLSTVALLYVLRLYFTTATHLFGYETFAAQGMKIAWTGESFLNLQFRGKEPYYYIILAMFVVCFLLCVVIKNSKTGYYLSAIQTNQDAAASLGVNVHGTKLKIAFISAFLTGVGGGFYAFFLSAIDPLSVFSYDLSIRIMLYGVIGGRGTLLGPVLGSFVLTPINEILRAELGSSMVGLPFVIYGLLTMLIVMFLPKGLVGIKEIVQKKVASAKVRKGKEGGAL